MCYSIYLSTDSDLDLSKWNYDLVRFRIEPAPEIFRPKLRFPYQWYVGSKSGCSCTFRHLYSVELGFGEPVDWYEEDEEEITATISFIKVIRKIVEMGFHVDCVDIWEGASPEEISEFSVNLDVVSDKQFRFFENHHFIFQGREVRI